MNDKTFNNCTIVKPHIYRLQVSKTFGGSKYLFETLCLSSSQNFLRDFMRKKISQSLKFKAKYIFTITSAPSVCFSEHVFALLNNPYPQHFNFCYANLPL